MDINKLIAEASAPLMHRIGDALDELRLACEAAVGAGFKVRLRTSAEGADATDEVINQRLVHFLNSAAPGLTYNATVQERTPE